MSRVEQRKAGFKSKPGSSGERTRKNEQLRKEKRSTMILAKRLKGASLGQEEQEQFSDAYLAEALQKIVGDVGARYEGLRMVRRLLCSAQPRISQLIGAGVVPLAAQMLVCPNEDLRLEAAWCLTNIATGNHEETGEVLAAAPQMLQLLLGGAGVTVALQEQVCWALGNIAGDCDEYRQVLLAHSCLPAVTHFLETATALPCTPAPASQGLSSPSPSSSSCTTTTPAQTAAWALSNLARGAVPGAAFVDLDKAPLLLRLLACGMGGGGGAGEGVGGGVGGVLAGGPDCVAVEVWWLFAFLSAKEDAAVEHYLQRGLLGAVAMALQSAVAQVGQGQGQGGQGLGGQKQGQGRTVAPIPLIRCLGNLSSGPERWIDALLGLGTEQEGGQGMEQEQGQMQGQAHGQALLGALVVFSDLRLCHRAVAKESLWVLGNLLGGAERQRRRVVAVAGAPLLERLWAAVLSDDFDVQHEALFALEQACRDATFLEQLRMRCLQGVQGGLGEQLCALLRAPGSSEVPLACAKIINALTFWGDGVAGMGVEWRSALLQLWVGAGVTEALDDLQYGGGGGGALGEVAGALVGKIYEALEQEEQVEQATQGQGQQQGMGMGQGQGQGQEAFSFAPLPANVFSQGFPNAQALGTGSPEGGRGRGRGADMNRPAWMQNPN